MQVKVHVINNTILRICTCACQKDEIAHKSNWDDTNHTQVASEARYRKLGLSNMNDAHNVLGFIKFFAYFTYSDSGLHLQTN